MRVGKKQVRTHGRAESALQHPRLAMEIEEAECRGFYTVATSAENVDKGSFLCSSNIKMIG